MAIRHDLGSLGDLALIADSTEAPGRQEIHLKAIINPLINLLWIAGAIFVLGSFITLWPDAREQRRLAERYDEALAPAIT
jgi:cytochrome c biogenesis factor